MNEKNRKNVENRLNPDNSKIIYSEIEIFLKR